MTTIINILNILIVAIQLIGVVVVLVSIAIGLFPYIPAALGLRPRPTVSEVRARLGRGLILSLDIFVAADLVRTVERPTMTDLIILAVVALIRVVLSFSLEFELRQVERISPGERSANVARGPRPGGGAV